MGEFKNSIETFSVDPGERKKWLKKLNSVQQDGRLVSMQVLYNDRDEYREGWQHMTRRDPDYEPAGITVNIILELPAGITNLLELPAGSTCTGTFMMTGTFKRSFRLVKQYDHRLDHHHVLINPAGFKLVGTEGDLKVLPNKVLSLAAIDYLTDDYLGRWEKNKRPMSSIISKDHLNNLEDLERIVGDKTLTALYCYVLKPQQLEDANSLSADGTDEGNEEPPTETYAPAPNLFGFQFSKVRVKEGAYAGRIGKCERFLGDKRKWRVLLDNGKSPFREWVEISEQKLELLEDDTHPSSSGQRRRRLLALSKRFQRVREFQASTEVHTSM